MTKLKFSISTFCLFTIAVSVAGAQTPPAKPVVVEAPASTQTFELRYASVPWNLNSKKIDSAFMFIRDSKTGKIAKINVEESEPDSSFFSGKFSVGWDGHKSLTPEVYVPPQNMRNDSRAVEKFNNLLNSGTILPQPVASKNEGGKFTIEVYDTKEQAERAQKAYAEQASALKKAERAQLIKPKLSDSSLQVAKMAEQANQVALLAKAAASREAERIHLEQIELQKQEQKKREQEKLSKLEIENRKAKAKKLAEQATALYINGQFKEAEPLYRESIELDPSSQDYYFKYGVTLYRNEKYDESLVTLKLAQTEGYTEIEKKYYMGLIYYKLKELGSARAAFKQVKDSNDPNLSASAAFYEGLVLMAEDDLVKAQASFEFVLDNSSDAALDKKAEEYIERIARLIQFKKTAAKKYTLNATIGAQYDSNILYTPDNDSASGSSVNSKGGLRGSIAGSGEYRVFYKEASDLSAKLSLSDTESASTDFCGADYFLADLTSPYNLKGTHKGTAYKLGLTPGYEYMQLRDGNCDLYGALQAWKLNADLMIVKTDKWFSSFSFDVRRDNSYIADSAANNADAIKTTVKKTEMLFLDTSKKRVVIGSLGVTINNAEGDEKKYSRVDFLGLYSAPILKFKNTTWTGGLTAYKQDYGSSTESRKDTNVGLIFGLNKVLTEDWSIATNASYSDNTSNVASSDYSKYILGTTISYTWSK